MNGEREKRVGALAEKQRESEQEPDWQEENRVRVGVVENMKVEIK